MLKYLIKASFLSLLSANSNAVEVCTNDELDAALPFSFLPASFDRNFRRKSAFQIKVTDPMRKDSDEVIDVVPDMSLHLKFGVLSGRDVGEFGGELTYRKYKDNRIHVIMERNIKAIYGSENSAIVFYRFSHMFKSEGKIFLFVENSGSWAICEIASYQDDIKDIHALDDNSIAYTVSGSRYVLNSKIKIDNNSLHSAH